MPGIVGPESYPIRKPTDPKQTNGRVVNPVRFMEMGGLDAAGKWAGHISTSMSSKKNDMNLEAGGPTGVRPAADTTGTNVDSGTKSAGY
jgi:hypothetical protein